MSKYNTSVLFIAAIAFSVAGSGCGSRKAVVVNNPPLPRPCPMDGCGPLPIDPIGPVGPILGSGSSSGSSGGYYPIPGPTPIGPEPVAGNGGNYYVSGSNGSASISGDTKDVDLQRAELQQQQVENQAQTMAAQFSMNIDSARQLSQIANRMATLQTQANGMTDDDRISLTEAALHVAGISNDQVNQAYADFIKGDRTAVNRLVDQAATNLGMPSSAGLREEVLPSLGINLGQ